MAPMSTGRQIDPAAPLDEFSRCHAGIATRLAALDQLSGLVEAAARARSIASDVLALFRDAVIEHHADEEKELFPAVLRSARPGEEAQAVEAMIRQLTHEHRAVEGMWKRLEPSLRSAARGAATEVDGDLAAELVTVYLRHARFEEQAFLPLAAQILGRNGNHMAALGMSLHLRHAPQVVGYL